MTKVNVIVSLVVLTLGACADDPVYFAPTPAALEINNPAGPGALLATVIIRIAIETAEEALARQGLADRLGLLVTDVPTVRRDLLDLSIEWTLKNLSDAPGQAAIALNGANEFFLYDPSVFVIDPLEDEPPPPLLGGVPILVPPRSYVSGTFSEAQVADAAQDLDAITRSGLVPEAALFTKWTTGAIDDSHGAITLPLPSEAVASLLQFDMSFTGNVHMVLEYVVRVRDHSGRLITDPAQVSGAIVMPSAVVFQPPPPPPMM